MDAESLCTENDFSPLWLDYRKLMDYRSEPKEKSGTSNNVTTTQQKYRCKKRYICFHFKTLLVEGAAGNGASELMFT